MMKKIIYKWSNILLLFALFFTSCSDILDKNDLSAINEDDVWSDETLALGFLNEIYDTSLSGWPILASGQSDDAVGVNSTIYGELNSNSRTQYSSNYRNIKNINLLLEKIETGGLDPSFQNLLKSQAYFFRAKEYFDLVSTYGGVPIVLKVPSQGVDDLELKRNKTSECITQIVLDLDSAINGLPNTYSEENYGRITKGAAMAFKAKVLLFYASEQFDPSQSAPGRWQNAYDAVKLAKVNLDANGKGLNPSYADLWFQESTSNPENIIVRKYNIDKTTNRDAYARPFVTGTSGQTGDKPTISHIEAYPMKDGKAITDGTSTYAYNSDVFWKNRDPRFTANIAFNGAEYQLNDPEPQTTSDLVWTFQKSQIEAQSDIRISPTAVLTKKAIDGSIEGGVPALSSPTDWIELRYAEVLLFLAEAANEIGNTAEAYTALEAIRQRAGIDEGGSGLYGLQAGMNKEQMRDAIMLERRIELAFEGKRSSDLRRRRMYSEINGTTRKGYYIEKTAAFDALNPSNEILDDRISLENGVLNGSINLNNPDVYTTFFTTQTISVERDGNFTDNGTPINYQENYYFFDLPQSAINKNPNLVQTIGWQGGTFNPLD